MAYLELQHLHTHFTKRSGSVLSPKTEVIRAVDGVDLSLQKGEILGLVGESGCGKSTLSRTVMQLIPATSGDVLLDGTSLTQQNARQIRSRRLDFQMIFQDPYASLNPRMTIFSTLEEALKQRHRKIGRRETQERIIALMETVGLDPAVMKKYP